jgi:iron complex outermembrane receptor protein
MRKNNFVLAPLSLAALMLSFHAHAQESMSVLGAVTVTGSREATLPSASILTSVDVMGAEMIEGKNVKNSWELPG